ncbi:hypothetical protein Tco_1270277 [Tanacetum coccineum]
MSLGIGFPGENPEMLLGKTPIVVVIFEGIYNGLEGEDVRTLDMSEDEISEDGLESDENDDNEHVNCENKDLQLSNGSHFENTCRRRS